MDSKKDRLCRIGVLILFFVLSPLVVFTLPSFGLVTRGEMATTIVAAELLGGLLGIAGLLVWRGQL